jgi:hypothetical protein
MKANGSSKKSRVILKAIAEGHSFEQILADNSTVNYHDIFRAAAQAPAHQWEQNPVRATTKRWPQRAPPPQAANLTARAVLRTAATDFSAPKLSH